ncbi:hypothetical protein [Synechococcus sp. MIT S1220]|uniref:hypothetical protein n=1 Tax=Synechococcus sp. MIT S1220 TaxID=3082549 RepID=UPI0039AF78AE
MNVEADSMIDTLYALAMLVCNKMIKNQQILLEKWRKNRNPFNLSETIEQVNICQQIIRDFQSISREIKMTRQELLEEPESWFS